jgi:peptidoglycan/LPS O-acetylase OafA/YrhL
MIKYRKDIDGLRAFAVLSVFIFHIKNNWLPGGYLGVDVFFVISGYLITSIIESDLKSDAFSIGQFYVKRFRRILPVMWFVTFVVLILGIFLFLPSDLKFLVNSIKSTLTFSSNYFFAIETDYFNPYAEQYPLLHTWSLAVEEQFYFIWPLLLLGIHRIKLSKLNKILILIIISLISYLFWGYSITSDLLSKFAYYSLPTRMGGLIIGGLIAHWHSDKVPSQNNLKSYQSILGFFILILSMIYKDKLNLSSPILSLIACIGAALILEAGSNSIINKILSLKWAVFIGTISYSLYLWHWPILAYFKYFGELKPISLFLVLILTFGLSIWTKYFIEDRYRKERHSFKSATFKFWLYPSLFYLSLCILIYDSGGFPQCYNFYSRELINDVQPFYKHYCHEQMVGNCLIGDQSQKPKVLLIGDSHASHFMPFWDLIGKEKNISIYARSSGFCFPSFEIENSDSKNCKEQKEWFQNHYKEFETIIFGGRWEFYLSNNLENAEQKKHFILNLNKTLKILNESKIKTILLAQIPKFKDQSYEYSIRKKYYLLGKYSSEPFAVNQLKNDQIVDEANDFILQTSSQYNGVVYFDPIRTCNTFAQKIPFRTNGMSYKDATHMNEAGSKELAQLFIGEKIKIPL